MIESFLKYLQFEKRASRHTTLAYKNDLRQFHDYLKQIFHEENISTADYGMIRSWIISLVESGLDAVSVNRKIACLRTFYKFLLRQEQIAKDPTAKIRTYNVKKPVF